MSMNILRAAKLKYGAIHSAEPKQMWGGAGREIEQNTILCLKSENYCSLKCQFNGN